MSFKSRVSLTFGLISMVAIQRDDQQGSSELRFVFHHTNN